MVETHLIDGVVVVLLLANADAAGVLPIVRLFVRGHLTAK